MGCLRFFLAMVVFDFHYLLIATDSVPNSFLAVYSFFIVSGFLMSMVLTEKYCGQTSRFYLGRALRLYPTYWIVVFACIFLSRAGIIEQGFAAMDWNRIFIFPKALWLNLTFDTERATDTQFLAQIYTVALEMMFYAIAPLIVRLELPNLIFAFGIAVIFHFVPYWLELPSRQWQYEFFPGTLMFFFAGVLAYRLYGASRCWRYPSVIGWLALIPIGGYWLVFDSAYGYDNDWRPIGYTALVAISIPFLFRASKDSRLDRFIGDLSYPLYVVHPLAIWLVWGAIGHGKHDFEKPITLFVAFALSTALAVLVDRPIDRRRQPARH
jgi:peptidoglycan/LPS O-acetylase OafA/YrhL